MATLRGQAAEATALADNVCREAALGLNLDALIVGAASQISGCW
ncbi:hypothetical protein [Micromonospora sp. NPDC023888]